MNIVFQHVVNASLVMADPTAPPPDSADKLKTAAKGSQLNFDFITDNPWIWAPIGTICGLLVAAMLFKGFVVGGTQIGFNGNKPGAVKEGMANAKNALLGAAMVTLAATVVGTFASFIANAVK